MKGALGILGGGQLGQMLAEAAKPLGVKVICFDPSPEACAKTQCEVIRGEYNDFDKLEKFCSLVDTVGVEFENVPLTAAKYVQSRKPLFPSLLALETAQDRLKEKNFFNNHGIVTNQFQDVSSLACSSDVFGKLTKLFWSESSKFLFNSPNTARTRGAGAWFVKVSFKHRNFFPCNFVHYDVI